MRPYGFCQHVTLTFDFLISGSMHAEPLPRSICVPSLVLIAQAVFLLEREHTHSHRRQWSPYPMHCLCWCELMYWVWCNRPFYKYVIYSMDCSGIFWHHASYMVSRIFKIINASKILNILDTVYDARCQKFPEKSIEYVTHLENQLLAGVWWVEWCRIGVVSGWDHTRHSQVSWRWRHVACWQDTGHSRPGTTLPLLLLSQPTSCDITSINCLPASIEVFISQTAHHLILSDLVSSKLYCSDPIPSSSGRYWSLCIFYIHVFAKKTWRDIVEKDCKARGLNREDAMDRSRWRKQIGMIDDYDECEWVNVSSGTSSPGLSRTKSTEP